MSSAGRSSRFLAAWYTRNNGGRAQRTLGWPAALIVFAVTFALAFTPSLCESCSSGVQSLQSNGMFSNAMNEYYQNITASLFGQSGSFSTSSGSESVLKSACKTAGAFYCSQGATVSVSWFLNGTSTLYSVAGSLSLCFPNACCEDQTCEDDNLLDGWVSNELVGTMNRLCQLTSQTFCYDSRGINVSINQMCREVTLSEIVIMVCTLVGVGLGACCCFGMLCQSLVRRFRRPLDYDRLVDDGLMELRENLLTHHVETYASLKDKDKYGDTCAICLESWKDTDEVSKFEPCGHLFHSDCISEWIRRKSTCPTCRTDWGTQA